MENYVQLYFSGISDFCGDNFFLYFLVPIKRRWLVLLGSSVYFYCSAGIEKMFFVLVTAGAAYITTCFAPNGHNMQTWRFTVIEDKEKIAQLKETTLAAAREHHVYCYGFENPACIILISNDERNPYGCQDASCAAENIFLAAHSYGIGSVWLNPLMTLRKKEPAKQILDKFGIPENHVIWCMAALGYPLEEGVLLARKEDVVHFVDG